MDGINKFDRFVKGANHMSQLNDSIHRGEKNWRKRNKKRKRTPSLKEKTIASKIKQASTHQCGLTSRSPCDGLSTRLPCHPHNSWHRQWQTLVSASANSLLKSSRDATLASFHARTLVLLRLPLRTRINWPGGWDTNAAGQIRSLKLFFLRDVLVLLNCGG